MNERFFKRSAAFTLIELLVVVAIIAVLIAILIPSLGMAKAHAKDTACLANLKGMGQAFFMYAGYHDDFLPPLQNAAPAQTLPIDPTNPTGPTASYSINWFGGQGSASYNSSVGALVDYWGQANIGGCPSFNQADYSATNFRVFYGPCDYAYNGILGALSTNADNTKRIRKIAEVKNPSQKALLWDSSRLVGTTYGLSRTPFGYPTDRFTSAPGPSGSELDPNVHGRHTGKMANVGWVDGHAEPFKPYLLDDLTPLGGSTNTFAGSAPSVAAPYYKQNNIGFVYDGPNPPTWGVYPAPADVLKYYDPNY